MHFVPDTIASLGGFPTEHLIALIALAGLGVAGFAIYAMLAVIKERKDK